MYRISISTFSRKENVETFDQPREILHCNIRENVGLEEILEKIRIFPYSSITSIRGRSVFRVDSFETGNPASCKSIAGRFPA